MSGNQMKKMDVLFVIDATGSMGHAIQAAHNKAEDIAFELKMVNRRKATFQFGSICYRDKVDVPKEENEIYHFNEEIEGLAEFFAGVEADGGGDGPEDYVGALNIAFNQMKWREGSKRAIIWIADAPAHGKRYCGHENHQEEEPKLQPLVEKLARDQYYFVGISINKGADTTFNEMKKIYDGLGGKSFVIESFNLEPGSEIDRIAETMATSTIGTVKAALRDF